MRCRLGAIIRISGLLDRGGVDHGERQGDRLLGHLPDRKQRAENDGKIDGALKNAALLFFRANDQSVSRFESFGGMSFGFHRVGLFDDRPYCNARAKA